MKENFNTQIKSSKDLKNSYDRIYKIGVIKESDRFYEWIINLMPLQRHKKLLDISCGGGFLLKEAEKMCLETYGIDISSVAINFAKNNTESSKIVTGNAEKLPWKDVYFDYITNLGSLEHYFNPQKAIMEMCRVLKPDGMCIIMLPNSFYIGDILRALFKGNGPSHGQEFERFGTKNEWKNLLEINGLKVDKVLKYNQFTNAFVPGTFKLKSIRKFLIQILKDYLVPFNLSYSFVYICTKE